MATAYGYTRVSTSKQDTTPEAQKQMCIDYYKAHLANRYEWGDVLHDHGVSATKVCWQDRPAGSKLLGSCKRGDIIITPMADRLFRTIKDQADSIDYLRQIGVEIVIINLGLDTTTPTGEMALTMLTAVGRMESAMKGERSRLMWQTLRRRRSPRKAHPPAGWWFNKKKGRLEPDHAERELLTNIVMWHDLKVRSITKSARWLRENKIKRRSGHMYRKQWIYHNRPAVENGFPCESFVRSWWEQRGDQYRKERDERLKRLKANTTLAKKARAALAQYDALRLRQMLTDEPPPATSQPDDQDEASLASLPDDC